MENFLGSKLMKLSCELKTMEKTFLFCSRVYKILFKKVFN